VTDSRLRLIIGILAVIGIGIATYITIEGKAVSCGTGGCETVLTSEYSDKFGISTSVIGLIGYVLILCSLFVPRDWGRMAGALLALVGFGVSAFLTTWSITTLETTCRWCLASAVTMTLLAILTTTRLLRAPTQ
jgi:uncharacterized membrane protein